MHPARAFINLLYPPACLLCEKPVTTDDAVLCPTCLDRCPRNGPPACVHCGLEQPGAYDAQPLCASCRRRQPVFDRACSPWRYAGSARRAVHAFKYRGRWRLGRWLADEMARQARRYLPLEAVDALVPVPLHGVKRWLRGGNPSDRLGRRIARQLGLAYAPRALQRRRWTRAQTRLRGVAARRRNVLGAFRARARLVEGRGVLLVDDVLTTGATADACAHALRAAGARHVFVLTAARTPRA